MHVVSTIYFDNISIGNYSGTSSGGSGFFYEHGDETSGSSGGTSGENGTDYFLNVLVKGNTSAGGSGSSSGDDSEYSKFWPKINSNADDHVFNHYQ